MAEANSWLPSRRRPVAGASQVRAVDAFPFHLVIDRALRLIQVGGALQRICPELRPGFDLKGHFCVIHPEGLLSCEHLFERPGEDAQVMHVGNGLRLRGEVVLQDGGEQLLFLGSPWVTDPPQAGPPDATLPMQDPRLRDEMESLRARESESRKLALVAAHSGSAVIMTDAQGRIEWVNEAFARITGYHLHEVIGKVPGAVLQGPATDPAVVRRMGDRLRSGQGFCEEVLNYARNGRSYWLAIEVQPIVAEDGRVTNFMAIERDISAEVTTRMQKTVQMEVWKRLVEAPSLDAGIQGILRLFCDGLGCGAGQVWALVDGALRWAHGWPGDGGQDGAAPPLGGAGALASGFGLPEHVRDTQRAVLIPDTITGPAGSQVDGLQRAGIRSAFAFPVSVDACFWGVFVFLGAEPLQADKAMLQTCELAQSQIGQFIARCNVQEELRRAKETAVRASESKSQFIATLSHEIRTPLNAVIGLGSLLAQLPMGQQQREHLLTLQQSSEQVLAIVNDVLDLSRLESGHAQPQAVDFSLVALVDNVVGMARALPGAGDLDIGSEVDPGIPVHLRCDAARLTQVLINLLGNAVKFTPQGSVRLRVSREPATVQGLWLSFSVIDSGQGIAPALQQRIFEPFEQGASAPRASDRGSGLGLAICRRIAAVLGGTLTLQSTEGRGSTFTFCLPVDIGDAPAPSTPTPLDVVHPRLRILVADDTPTSQLVIRRILERLGHAVQVVADGEMAVEAFLRERFDLVFLDIQMPRMDGCQAARAIRDRGKGAPGMPIVGLSAHAQEAARTNALSHGMTHYLCKPIRFEDVVRLLDEIRESQGRQALADAAIDREMLAELCELMTPEGLSLALQQFEQDADTALARLQGAAEAAEEQHVPRLAHRLKGLFAQFGAHGMADDLSTLERLPEGERCTQALELVGRARVVAGALHRVAASVLQEAG
jgi:PAS domain S-box-containing protein